MLTRTSMMTCLFLAAAMTGCQSDDSAMSSEEAYSEEVADFGSYEVTEAPVEEARITSINLVCPVGLDPITADSPTMTYKGWTIAFCCPMCQGTFMKEWDETARDRWLVAAMQDPNYVP